MINVILVDENDFEVGTMEKMKAHREGVLHRAFSIFIYNSAGEMLLQRRSRNKYHNGGLWTNSCCSHPLPGEDTFSAAYRRLKEEMGFCAPLEKIFDFTYRVEFENGLTEYEFDHVFIGEYDGAIVPDYTEVSDYCFMKVKEIRNSIHEHPEKFTAWFKIAFEKVTACKNSQQSMQENK